MRTFYVVKGVQILFILMAFWLVIQVQQFCAVTPIDITFENENCSWSTVVHQQIFTYVTDKRKAVSRSNFAGKREMVTTIVATSCFPRKIGSCIWSLTYGEWKSHCKRYAGIFITCVAITTDILINASFILLIFIRQFPNGNFTDLLYIAMHVVITFSAAAGIGAPVYFWSSLWSDVPIEPAIPMQWTVALAILSILVFVYLAETAYFPCLYMTIKIQNFRGNYELDHSSDDKNAYSERASNAANALDKRSNYHQISSDGYYSD